MIIKIAKVAVSNGENPRTYARDILGRTFFPQTKDMELKAGDYAYAIETLQTKSYAEDGTTLVEITPTKILQITATFATKAEAVAAAAEVGTIGMEVAAEVNRTAKELGLTAEAVKELAAAW